MSNDADKTWDRLKNLFERSEQFPPTDDDLDAFKDTEHMSTGEIESIFSAALSGVVQEVEPTPEVDTWETDICEFEDEALLQLNRNADESTEDVEKRLKELRERMLNDDDESKVED